MEIIEGQALSNKCDYSFGDHMGAVSIPRPKGGFMKQAWTNNIEFLEKCKEFEGKVMTLFIDNIRLYNRPVFAQEGNDAKWVEYLLSTNDLLRMCETLKNNTFVIFTSHEDTPIDEHIKIPDNVLGIHAVNAEYFGGKIHPFPYGLQRELENDNRLSIMKENVENYVDTVPNKLLYINCGIGRNKDREPLASFETNEWVTTRFDKDSKFFPYDRYQDFLDELKDHKFVVCPPGHGLDCHRNWETLYMRRVPVMRLHPYFHELMKGFPILWVSEWSDISRELLENSLNLFEEAKVMNRDELDLTKKFGRIMANYKPLT